MAIKKGELMIVQWDEGISVHNATIDEQHKRFITLLNNLDDLTGGEGVVTRKVMDALSFLEEYVKTHFAYEESYFTVHKFPEAIEHKADHARFLRMISMFREELSPRGASMKLANDISRFMSDWLVAHVRNVDHRYCVFVETGVMPPSAVRKFKRS